MYKLDSLCFWGCCFCIRMYQVFSSLWTLFASIRSIHTHQRHFPKTSFQWRLFWQVCDEVGDIIWYRKMLFYVWVSTVKNYWWCRGNYLFSVLHFLIAVLYFSITHFHYSSSLLLLLLLFNYNLMNSSFLGQLHRNKEEIILIIFIWQIQSYKWTEWDKYVRHGKIK